MLQHKFTRLPVCFAKLSASACLLASQFACQKNTTENKLRLAAAWTCVGFADRALELLSAMEAGPCRDVEIARALVASDDARRSIPFSALALDAFAERVEAAPMYAEALLLLGQAHVRLGKLRCAAELMVVAIDMVTSLSVEQAIEVMKIIGQMCDRRGDQSMRAAAYETICRIVDEEEPDPRAREAARAELTGLSR